MSVVAGPIVATPLQKTRGWSFVPEMASLHKKKKGARQMAGILLRLVAISFSASPPKGVKLAFYTLILLLTNIGRSNR